ncbi:hypothetical protein GF361_03595 [Candidatus Woesearchaeota archaeon]|nr:hypothetical protein [Candidatus Woesearchaeota archaeon]
MFRNRGEKYIDNFVYGATDGAVTTFAVVAGAIGASLSSAIILILGFANLFADGFSMAVGNYLSTKSENEIYAKHKHHHHHKKDPRKTALATFISFVLIGFIPLISFVFAPIIPAIDSHKFLYAILLTGIAFLAVGAVKGKVIEGKTCPKCALETFLIGGIAAIIAFVVGYLLRGLAG